MAVSDIQASTGTIISVASQIKGDANKYSGLYQQMYGEINALRASWTSADGDAYINKINSYKDSFELMKTKLTKAAESLETSARNYESALKANQSSIG